MRLTNANFRFGERASEPGQLLSTWLVERNVLANVTTQKGGNLTPPGAVQMQFFLHFVDQ
jgi:hypothetical protein